MRSSPYRITQVTSCAICLCCADDVLLLAQDDYELQSMLDVTRTYSQEHKYTIHPDKSSITIFHPSGLHGSRSWTMGEGNMPITPKFTHLGLDYDASNKDVNVAQRINLGRRTLYSEGRMSWNKWHQPSSQLQDIQYIRYSTSAVWAGSARFDPIQH